MVNFYFPLQKYIISFIPNNLFILHRFMMVNKSYYSLIKPIFEETFWEDLSGILGYHTSSMIRNGENFEGGMNFNSALLNKRNCLYISRVIGRLDNLKGIYFWHNKMTLDGLKLLVNPLSNLSRLNELYLGNNNVTDDGCIYLSSLLKHLPNLKWLNLCRNKITSVGCFHLSESLVYLKKLEYLVLCNNMIDCIGCKYLGDSMKELNHITNIYFNNNNIKIIGLYYIVEGIIMSSTINSIYMIGNYIKSNQVNSLSDKYKNLKNIKSLIFY